MYACTGVESACESIRVGTKPRNGTHLRRLDVIVEVVSKGLNMGDIFDSSLWCKMSWEQD